MNKFSKQLADGTGIHSEYMNAWLRIGYILQPIDESEPNLNGLEIQAPTYLEFLRSTYKDIAHTLLDQANPNALVELNELAKRFNSLTTTGKVQRIVDYTNLVRGCIAGNAMFK